LSTEDLELSLRRNQENLQYLQSQYDLSGRPWTPEDRKQRDELQREQRRLQSLRQSKLRTGQASRRGRSDDAEELSCWDKCWNILQPIRLVIAIPLLLISLLLIVSLSITVVDKFEHSPCGAGCGYTLAKTHILNPIDEAFKGLSKAFPMSKTHQQQRQTMTNALACALTQTRTTHSAALLFLDPLFVFSLCSDCIFFAGLVLYIFLCCVSGIVGMGVRFFVIKLYSIQKGKTMPNAFLMAAWMLQVSKLPPATRWSSDRERAFSARGVAMQFVRLFFSLNRSLYVMLH